jgi:hypothetical protein
MTNFEESMPKVVYGKVKRKPQPQPQPQPQQGETPMEKRIEGEQYKVYKDFVYPIVAEAMAEFSVLSKMKKRKILRYKQLPVEAVFIFKRLEAHGFDINEIDPETLKDVLKKAFKMIDRKDEYDLELMGRVGQMETLRWRGGDKLEDEASFSQIVATLKNHAGTQAPRTISGQNPRARLAPRGEYHKKGSLS